MSARGSVAIFPGQGSQTVGMGASLAKDFGEFREALEEASDAVGLDVAKLCFDDPEKALNLTEFTQIALLAVSTATFRVLRARAGFRPTFVAGHSLGEYSALVAAEVLDFGEALRAVRHRGQAMQKAVPVGLGAMAAYLGSEGAAVEALCREASSAQGIGKVEVVNFNSPGQLVLSGHAKAVEAACGLVETRKLGRTVPLSVSAPFHSSLMEPAARAMEDYLKVVKFKVLNTAIVANVDARIYRGGEYGASFLVEQVARPVLWRQSLETLNGALPEERLWVEVGTGSVLRGLLKKTIPAQSAVGTSDSEAMSQTLEKIPWLN